MSRFVIANVQPMPANAAGIWAWTLGHQKSTTPLTS
jgi:hypothetical protein